MKNILIISDNKPGHDSLSFGLIEYLKKYDEIEVTKLEMNLKFGFYKFVLTKILNTDFFIKRLSVKFLNFFYSYSKIDFTQFDLIISSGGNNTYANVILSKIFNIPNVLATYLRGLNHTHFSYIVNVSSNEYYPNTLMFEVAPVKITYNEDKVKRFKDKYLDHRKVWSILIGGQTKEYPFNDNEILQLVKNIVEKAVSHNAVVLLTTSRRTAKNIENKLSKLLMGYTNIAYKVFYNHDPEKIMQEYIYNSDLIFVTEESASMVTEAISSKKPVITLRNFESFNDKYKYHMYVKRLSNSQYIFSCEINKIKDLDIDELYFRVYDESQNEENIFKIYQLMQGK